jgi:hypothetical protein
VRSSARGAPAFGTARASPIMSTTLSARLGMEARRLVRSDAEIEAGDGQRVRAWRSRIGGSYVVVRTASVRRSLAPSRPWPSGCGTRRISRARMGSSTCRRRTERRRMYRRVPSPMVPLAGVSDPPGAAYQLMAAGGSSPLHGGSRAARSAAHAWGVRRAVIVGAAAAGEALLDQGACRCASAELQVAVRRTRRARYLRLRGVSGRGSGVSLPYRNVCLGRV